MSVHFSSKSDTWRTPEWVLDVVKQFAPIDFDPCPDPDHPDWTGCKECSYDGLVCEWKYEHVYVNPPYSKLKDMSWINKMASREAEHVTALLPSRTDTKWFHQVMDTCSGLCFLKGRLKFSGHANSAPFPNAIAYWGNNPCFFNEVWRSHGRIFSKVPQDYRVMQSFMSHVLST